MRELTFDEVRKIQLEILNDFAIFCKYNKIKYFLSSGTLLGAVRHKGYIPWDDDIDVMMLRKDYIKFENLYQNNKGKYKLFTYHNTKPYNIPFMKLSDTSTLLIEDRLSKVSIGVNIDIFPIDNIPEKKLPLFYSKLKLLRKLLKLKTYEGRYERSFLRKYFLLSMRYLIFFLPVKRLLNRLDRLAQKERKSSLRGLTVWGYFEKEICRYDVFEDTVLIEFEGGKYCAPKSFHQYLTNIYGDYMKLPPENMRICPHNFTVYEY